jgi:DNA-binding response OmpR family regulator
MSDASGTKKATILIADDDEDLVGYVKFRLEREGYHVLTANDGDQAVKLAIEYRPQLAVLDVQMPRLDGLAVTRLIRSHRQLEGMPVILLTGSVEEEHISEGYEAGATDYLTKPFTGPGELVTCVRSALGDT